jgi:hypothetical protein
MSSVFDFIRDRLFSNGDHVIENNEEPVIENNEEDETIHTSGFMMVIRSEHELTEGAVAVVRIESNDVFNSNQPDRRRQEIVYYPDESEVFFALVTGSLSRGMGVTIHTNQDPSSLGLIKGPNGSGKITRVEQLGGA